MENAVLNNFFKPFQLIGLQCFSIRNLDTKGSHKYPSIYYNIYLVVLLVGTTGFGVFNSNNYTKLPASGGNYLHVVIKFINFINYALTIYLALMLSFVKHSTLVKFFLNSSKICDLCAVEFNYQINFRRMIRQLALTMLIPIFILIKLFYDLVVPVEGSFGTPGHLRNIIWWLVAIFIYMIVLRFNYHVSVVNFHLEVLNELIEETFPDESKTVIDWKSAVKTIKVHPMSYLIRIKIKTLKKIFMLIKEMSDCVNETMGFIILLRLLMIITNMIRFGYDFLKNISEPIDVPCEIQSEMLYE